MPTSKTIVLMLGLSGFYLVVNSLFFFVLPWLRARRGGGGPVRRSIARQIGRVVPCARRSS